MNARNFLYIKRLNPRAAIARSDDKLATKRVLLSADIPTPGLIAEFTSLQAVRAFHWESLEGDFALKPAHGFGGGGITVVRGWNGHEGKARGHAVSRRDLEGEVFNILDGAYSITGLPDAAFLEERVVVNRVMQRLSAGGVPDVRIIVCNGVPIMAMLRLPTEASGGKANLHQGALGIGIDMRTGITTRAILHGASIGRIPGTDTKVRGIKIPSWDTMLDIAVRAQRVSGLGYAGIDIVVDAKRGPLVLEINARPGLQIQLANNASLRTRLERVAGMKIPTSAFGIDLAKRVFAEHDLAHVGDTQRILNVIETVTVYGPKGRRVIQAKIDTGAYRTAIDSSLAEALGIEPGSDTVFIQSGSGTQTRPIVEFKLRIRDTLVNTVASYNDRSHLRFPMIIGRRDLGGFLVDPDTLGED